MSTKPKAAFDSVEGKLAEMQSMGLYDGLLEYTVNYFTIADLSKDEQFLQFYDYACHKVESPEFVEYSIKVTPNNFSDKRCIFGFSNDCGHAAQLASFFNPPQEVIDYIVTRLTPESVNLGIAADGNRYKFYVDHGLDIGIDSIEVQENSVRERLYRPTPLATSLVQKLVNPLPQIIKEKLNAEAILVKDQKTACIAWLFEPAIDQPLADALLQCAENMGPHGCAMNEWIDACLEHHLKLSWLHVGEDLFTLYARHYLTGEASDNSSSECQT